jgi:hypothetical protein
MTRAGRPEVMNHFTAKELACLSWGLGCAQVYVTPEFLDALQRRALELAPEFSCMGVCSRPEGLHHASSNVYTRRRVPTR